MLILMKSLNEENYVNRCISDFHNEDWIDQIIVIDGNSTDYTVQELKRFEKVKVFIHNWNDSYHDMEVCQSNIGLSYIPNGKMVFILDFDERMSNELKNILKIINEKGMPNGVNVCNVSRKTFDLLRHEDSPFAMIGDDGWPLVSNQIGQYPDYQCRLLKKDYRMRWVNSPHHTLIGWEDMRFENINADVLHYEKDDYRERLRIERKWARSLAIRKELGLPCDIYEVNISPEVHKYTNIEEWR